LTKYILIDQPAGLGDIFFLQKAVKNLIDLGNIAIWPVISNFSYIKDYIQYENLIFVNKEENFSYKEIFTECEIKHIQKPLLIENLKESLIYIPFIRAESPHMHGMKCKYPLVQNSSDNWQNYFKFERNIKRELELKEKYNIQDGEEFIFVNDLFASPPDMLRRNIDIKTKKKIIYNDGEPCHIFDYCWLFENASEIHTIESAFCYLAEVLDTNAKLFMYSRIINGRPQHNNFDYIDHVYKKNWFKIL